MAGFSGGGAYSGYKAKNLLGLGLLALFFVIMLELTQHVLLPFLSRDDPWGCPFPETMKAVSAEMGGTPDEWYKSGQFSWTYNGQSNIQFKVPDGCVLDAMRAGESVIITKGDTYTWPRTQ